MKKQVISQSNRLVHSLVGYRTIVLSLFWVFIQPGSVHAQTKNGAQLIQEGIGLHDEGKYEEALQKYQEALELDPQSIGALYETSYTYMLMKRYDEAIGISKKILKIKDNNGSREASFIVLGTCYDMLAKPEKALDAYQEGIREFPASNLLNYNLAITANSLKKYDIAGKAAFEAMYAKPSHSSSQLVMASVQYAQNQRIKALLACYYFLMLEPDSDRSPNQLKMLKYLLYGMVTQQDNNTINISISSQKGVKDYSNLETLLGLHVAARTVDKNKDKSDMEFFVETTQLVFENISETNNQKNKWSFYSLPFSNIAKQTDLLETFCYYISRSAASDQIDQWLNTHNDRVEKLKSWINDQQKKEGAASN